MKQCSKCKIEKSETEFHRHKDGIDGLNPSCKECVNTQHRAHYSTHLNQEKYRIKAYRETHLEDAKAYRNTHLVKMFKKQQ